MPIFDVEESRLITTLLEEFQLQKENIIEQLIQNASQSNNEGATGFCAGKLDAVNYYTLFIEEAIKEINVAGEKDWT